MKAVILGTSGYTGMVLLRLLADHPAISAVIPVSSSKAGDALAVIDPGLSSCYPKADITGGKLVSVDDAAAMKPDVVFAALPHLESARICEPFFGKSIVIDLSADFRIRNREVFRKAYGEEPPRPDLLPQAVYGLCEVYRGSIRKADIIANPGCYPTATLLPLIPILRSFPVENLITVNALSGISGAGKKAKIDNLFCERAENTCAYSPGKTHRHSVEIEQELVTMVPEVNLLFTPHLVPLKRGMNSTTVITLKEATEKDAILSCLKDFYADSAFVQVVHPRIPETKDVWGTNRCDIGFHLEGKNLILMSVIDNLVKGASGQAVQNMNIRFGLPETQGLKLHGEY